MTARLSGEWNNAQVRASFFGVGAPEAVLVGLVALVIFGPQGLAEVGGAAAVSVQCAVEGNETGLLRSGME